MSQPWLKCSAGFGKIQFQNQKRFRKKNVQDYNYLLLSEPFQILVLDHSKPLQYL